MSTVFTGSGVAIVTPFNDDNSIDFETFGKLVDFHLENHTDAIIVCGTTGEASTLVDAEHLEAIKFVLDRVNKRIPVIAGAGSNDTKHGVELCIDAEKIGADACLLVTPYYNKANQQGLYEHYLAHAKAIDIPIILYNVPSRTGLNIAPETAGRLSKIENIVAIKEASSNIVQIAEVAEHAEGRLDIYSGNDDQIIPILSLGGKGVISVVANIIPKETHDLCQNYFDGNFDKALEMQLKSLQLVRAIFSDVNPIPVKTALKHMGYDGFHFRLPLTYMDSKKEELLVKAMKDYGIKVN